MTISVLAQALVSGLLNGIMYGLLALGFTMMYGVLNIVNFAHGSQIMFAMFCTYILFTYYQIDPYVSLFIIVPVSMLLGIALYKMLFSKIVGKSHSTQIVVTLSLLIFFENAFNFLLGGNLRGIQTAYASSSIILGNISLPLARVYAALIALLVIVVFTVLLHRTDFGAAVRAAYENRLGALLVGVNVNRVYLISVAIVFLATAVYGVVSMPYSLVSPSSGGSLLEMAFVITVVGGLGSFNGALVAGLIVGVVEVLSGVILKPEFTKAIVFGMLMLVILFKPNGILSKSG